MSGNINGFFYNYDMTMTADPSCNIQSIIDAATNADPFSPSFTKRQVNYTDPATTQQANP